MTEIVYIQVSSDQYHIPKSLTDEPVAKLTSWEPNQKEGAHVANTVVSENDAAQLLIKSSYIPEIIFALSWLVAIGICSYLYYKHLTVPYFFDPNSNQNIAFYLGMLVLAPCGIYMGYLEFKKRGMPLIIDKNEQMIYCKKWFKPVPYHSLHHAYAIQLIPEFVVNKFDPGEHYLAIEVNLVFENGERITLLDHANRRKILESADKIKDYLNIPIWRLESLEKMLGKKTTT